MKIAYELNKNECFWDLGPGQVADAIFENLGTEFGCVKRSLIIEILIKLDEYDSRAWAGGYHELPDNTKGDSERDKARDE